MVSVTCQADQGDGSASVAITAGTVAGQFNGGGIFFFFFKSPQKNKKCLKKHQTFYAVTLRKGDAGRTSVFCQLTCAGDHG